MKKFRFHVVGLPHTVTNKTFCPCAYTMKVYNFCKMMKSLGHEVFHYGAEGSTPDCTEHVQIISNDEQQRICGVTDMKAVFNPTWNPSHLMWSLTNSRAAIEIMHRQQKHDFLCVIGGHSNKPLADNLKDLITVEFGIGYEGVFAPFKVFESYTHMALIAGLNRTHNEASLYDAVIPNYFDPADFPVQKEVEDYYMFLGRVQKCKGVDVAVRATTTAGVNLLIAGQGVKSVEGNKITTDEGEVFDHENVAFAGVLGVEDRARILGKAKALIVPSRYIEPFGGVAVEAQLLGVPVISTDWGAFAETVEHGVTGYRCRTLEHFVKAIHQTQNLNREVIRKRALSRYSLNRVRMMYHEYFRMLHQAHAHPDGWKAMSGDAHLNWLTPMA